MKRISYYVAPSASLKASVAATGGFADDSPCCACYSAKRCEARAAQQEEKEYCIEEVPGMNWFIRKKALEEKLTDTEFFRVLYHIAKHPSHILLPVVAR